MGPIEQAIMLRKHFSRRWVRYALIGALACAFVLLGVCIYPITRRQDAPFGMDLSNATGWDQKQIAAVDDYLDQTEVEAAVVLQGQRVVLRYGQYDKLFNSHSIRKSIISALYGIAVDKGLIRLENTLASLSIDESRSPLTESEKQATVRDLLMARSGVYLEAQGESEAMKRGRPTRGQYQPGEHWYYNNWDFNVLGAIFENQTEWTIGDAIYEWIAKPTGMKHFDPSNVIYTTSPNTDYRMYRIWITAEDLARLGVLYLQGGKWDEEQVIPKDWIYDSTRPYSTTKGGYFDSYGYLWWLDTTDGTIWADGWGGQVMVIDQTSNLVIVTRNNTGNTLGGIALYQLFGKEATRENAIRIHDLLIDETASDQ
jgi:CubicO group peptidase (beta-lactamase class C family)